MKLQFLLLAPAIMAVLILDEFYVTKAGELKTTKPLYGITPQEVIDNIEKYAGGKCFDWENGENGKVEWNEGWEEKAVFGRFRQGGDVFINFWPKDDNRWEMFEENGDGTMFARCYRYPKGKRICGEKPYAWCTSFGSWEDEQDKRDVEENGAQGEFVEMIES
ncbi:hypothetical protein DICA0_B13256 [Diutina catenulata]